MDIIQKIKGWEECLSGLHHDNNDPIDINSIDGIIITLIREMAIFDCYINICNNNPKSPLASSVFFRSFVSNYFYSQYLRIRKLTDLGTSEDEGQKNKQIYSLSRIYNEMKKYSKEGNKIKEAFCSFYCIEENRIKADEDLKKAIDELFLSEDNKNYPHASSTVQLHKDLDKIFNDSGEIKKTVKESLDKKLLVDKNNNLKQIRDMCSKYLAHAATAESRHKKQTTYLHDQELIKSVLKELTESYLLFKHLIRRADLILINEDIISLFNNLDGNESKIISNTIKDTVKEIEEWNNYCRKILGYNDYNN